MRTRDWIRERPAALGALLTAPALLLALAAPAPAVAAPVAARPADALADSVGVNVHFDYEGTPYQTQFAAVKQRLLELGVRHVRDVLSDHRPDQVQSLNSLAAAGVGSDLVLSDPAYPESVLEKEVVILHGLSGVEAVEGPNEYGLGSEERKAKLRAYQQHLYETIKGDPALAALPVLGPSLVGKAWEELGDVSAFLDAGNIHVYPEGNQPQNRLQVVIERAATNSGAKPLWATETGYTNALNWTPAGAGENKPISEAAAGVYYPRLLLEYFAHGLVRTYPYELLDDAPDPELDDREKDFGLLRNDLSPKPAFTAVGNLLHLLADPGPDFAAGSLDYSLLDSGTQLHSQLLEKRDGTFYLALWRWKAIWNPDEKKELTVAPEPVQVQLAQPTGAYAVYEPAVSAEPVASGAPTSSVTVPVGAGATVLELRPAEVEAPPAAEPIPIPAPVSTGAPGAAAIIARASVPLAGARKPLACRVPSLLGSRLAAARKRLRAAGCHAAKVRRRSSSTAEPGRVTAQRPAAGRTIAATAPVTLTVAR